MSPLPVTEIERAPSVEFSNVCPADELLKRRGLISEGIVTRAREFAESRGEREGYTPSDYVQAESEILRPVEIQIAEYAETITINARVLGFEANELRVSIEPRRIIIAGKKEQQPQLGNRLFYVDWYPDEILRVVELPEDVDPALSRLSLHAGALTFELFKAHEWPERATGIMDG